MPALRSLVLAIAWASNAAAQGAALDLGAEGHLALGVTDRVPGADVFLFGDATARMSFGGALGLELGVYGLADATDTPHETYGTVTLDLASGGRLAAGVPRPAYDGFAVSALEGPFPSLGTAHSGTSRSVTTSGAMFANFLPYGLRFENETGRLGYAASIHHVPNQDLTVAGLGLALPAGDWTVEGAVEVARGAATEAAGKLQVHRRAGPARGGLGLYLPGTVGGAEAMELFGAVDAGDRVTVSGVVQVPLGGAADPSAGAAVGFRINERVGLSAGVLSDAGADAAFNALIGLRF